MLTGALLLIGLLVFLLFLGLVSNEWSRWREQTITRTLSQSGTPAFWWPPGWRRELETSILLQGTVSQARSGTLEILSESTNRVHRTTVTGGRFAFDRERLPAGPCKARFVNPDGSPSQWLNLGPLDPGRHRINLRF